MGTIINILSTNDIHGRFFGGYGEAGEIDFSCLCTLKKNLKNSLLVDIGDATQGTPLAILNKGLDPIKIMNCVGYDVTTIGNHEFDNITLKTENELDTIIENFNAPFICTNVYWNDGDGKPQNYIDYVYKKKNISGRGNGRYLVKEVAGKKLLFVGVCTPIISATPKMKSYVIKGKAGDVGEDSMEAQIRSAISAAKKEHGNFDAVILLSHLGKDTEEYSSSKLISSLTAEDRKDIKLIIDGHSHKKYFDEPTTAEPDRPYLLQADCYGKLCAHITLNFDDAGGLKIGNSFLDATEVCKKKQIQDEAAKKKIESIKANVDEAFGKAICDGSNTTLWGGAVDEKRPFVPKDLAAINVTRHIHTNMGRLTAAAMAHYIRTKKPDFFDSEADYIVAGINGGGVRDSIRFGQEINYGKLYSVAPSQREGLYDSGIAVFKVKLSRLKIVLSNSVDRIKVEGNFLTTNAGMFLNTFGLKYTVDYTANGSLKINDSAALTCGVNDYLSSKTVNFEKDKDKKVLICVNKYLATGGDEYPFKFDKDEDLVAGGLEVDTPIYQMMGDYIKEMAESNGKILFYPAVSDDIQYNGFNFPKPDTLNITVTDEKNISQKGTKIIYAFANDRGYHNFGAMITNDAGVFKVTPAEGAHTLCIAVLLSGATVNNTFLYGEVFTHSYLKMEPDIECQVSQMDSSKYCLFSKNHLSQFKHSFIGTANSHHSNYIDYIDENGNQCALTIVDNKIYSRKGSGNSFEQVSSVQYKNIDGGNSTLTMPFPNGGIDYIPWVGQNAKVHADLIQNPEVSDLCGGGDARINSTYCDGTLFAKNRQNRVTGFHVQHGEILDGIGFIYADNNEYFFGNPTGGRGDVFRFAEGEYITKITGSVRTTYYNCVTNLKIITNKKEYGPFGWSAEKEKPFEISKANHKICALLGEEAEPKNWDKKVVRKIGAMFMPVQQLK